MDTIPQDRSHLRGTGPSSYGTGPILLKKMVPVPKCGFPLKNTIISLIWARSNVFLLIFAQTNLPSSAVLLSEKQYKLQKTSFQSRNLNLREIRDWSHDLLAEFQTKTPIFMHTKLFSGKYETGPTMPQKKIINCLGGTGCISLGLVLWSSVQLQKIIQILL